MEIAHTRPDTPCALLSFSSAEVTAGANTDDIPCGGPRGALRLFRVGALTFAQSVSESAVFRNRTPWRGVCVLRPGERLRIGLSTLQVVDVPFPSGARDLARDPSVPPALYPLLLDLYPCELLQNPLWPLLLLEDASLAALPIEVRRLPRALSEDAGRAPSWFWSLLCRRHPSSSHLARIPNLPGPVLASLLAAAELPHHDALKAALAENPQAPPDLLAQCAVSANPSRRLCAALHPRTPAPQQAALASAPEPLVRAGVAEHVADPAVQAILARDPEFVVRLSLAANPQLSPPLLAHLLAHEGSDPAPAGIATLQSSFFSFRALLLLLLATHPRALPAQRRHAVERLGHAPPKSEHGYPSIGARLMRDEIRARARALLALLAPCPEERPAVASLLAAHPNFWLREGVARAPEAPVSSVEALVRDPSFWVVVALAERFDLAPHHNDALLRGGPRVWRSLAAHSSHPETLYQLAICQDSPTLSALFSRELPEDLWMPLVRRLQYV